MTTRAAIRNQRRFLPRLSYREQDLRRGRTASLLPGRLTAILSAGAFTLAAFSLIFTATTERAALLAESDAPAITGTIKAN